jgi:hypothetical protein
MYNEDLDRRISEITAGWGAERKKMFGGTCHLINGNMMCGVYKDFLILRIGGENAEHALSLPHVRPFDITGKPTRGWIMVEEEGFKGPALKEWILRAKGFVQALPPKSR